METKPAPDEPSQAFEYRILQATGEIPWAPTLSDDFLKQIGRIRGLTRRHRGEKAADEPFNVDNAIATFRGMSVILEPLARVSAWDFQLSGGDAAAEEVDALVGSSDGERIKTRILALVAEAQPAKRFQILFKVLPVLPRTD